MTEWLGFDAIPAARCGGWAVSRDSHLSTGPRQHVRNAMPIVVHTMDLAMGTGLALLAQGSGNPFTRDMFAGDREEILRLEHNRDNAVLNGQSRGNTGDWIGVVVLGV